MGKDKTEKKDKREKKEKRAEKDGVHKSKKDKKEKKDKTVLAEAVEKELTTKVLEGIDQADGSVNGDKPEVMEIDGRPVGAVVPFASPLVEDKSAKKVLKTVKKGKNYIPFALRSLPVEFCPRILSGTLHLVPYSMQPANNYVHSRRQQMPQARCEGGRQGPSQVPHPRSQRPGHP
jgi:hypothetical protein